MGHEIEVLGNGEDLTTASIERGRHHSADEGRVSANCDHRLMTDHRQLQSKWVPYVDKRIPVGANRFLPRGPYDALTAARVDDFVRVTATDRDIRLQVLAVLRMHSSNGAEVVLGLAAMLLAGLAIVVSAFVAITGWGTMIAVVYAGAALAICGALAKPAVAAHARKMTALVWLGAYEDRIRDNAAGVSSTPAQRHEI